MTLGQTPALIRKDSHWAPWQVLTIRDTKCSHASQLHGYPWTEITKLIAQCNFFVSFTSFYPKILGVKLWLHSAERLVRHFGEAWIQLMDLKRFQPMVATYSMLPLSASQTQQKCAFHSSNLSVFQRKFWYFSFPTPRGIWHAEQ